MTKKKLPIIIFEGANGLGKTTSIKSVSEFFRESGTKVIERRNHELSPTDFFVGTLFNERWDKYCHTKTIEYAAMNLSAWLTAESSGAIDVDNTLILSDRMHLTEKVYGEKYRKEITEHYHGGSETIDIINMQFETFLNRNFDVHLITVVTSEEFESVDSEQNQLNDMFRSEHDESIINSKHLVEIDYIMETEEKVRNLIEKIMK